VNHKTLIIGIGNSGRQDDGLGWAFLDAIESLLLENIDLEYRYQLQVEDAELIARYNSILFVDADMVQHPNGFNFEKLYPKDVNSYTSHELNPETVLHLAKTIYNVNPECYMLSISGITFHLNIGLTEIALLNLDNAIRFFKQDFYNAVTTF
jgi:hydrogenase maturation protease